MTFNDALTLGRISNLPTVWTNVLAAGILVGASPSILVWFLLILSMSLFYVAGMYLNDIFDVRFDRLERPDRPIPSGRVKLGVALACATFMVVLGLGILLFISLSDLSTTGYLPLLAGIGLTVSILLYNAWHKNNPFSPLLMGLCRAFVYLTIALAFVAVPPVQFWIGMVVLICYLIGLTYIAKQENLNSIRNYWPAVFLLMPIAYSAWLSIENPRLWFFSIGFSAWVAWSCWFLLETKSKFVPKAVVNLIAGMCILDSILIAGAGRVDLAVVCIAGFVLTLFLQRYVSGT